jgi:hypothetical protein
MVKEYKKMQEEYDSSLSYSHQRTQENLQQRLGKRSQGRGDRAGEGSDGSGGGVTLSELTEALQSIDLTAPGGRQQPSDRWLEEQLKEESSHLLSQHNKHHSQLVRELPPLSLLPHPSPPSGR